ncbi:Ig-like domain-containing protein [Cellulomonas endometrii]|uniref:Ig-like domain-containing protein n=1 Tax=Cellulomonas endometrii TaxID=3036301 RepID=UPI0024AE3691|nr:Ig-like domain-containing protein [Cellulomonas endometrii]
MRRTPAVVTLTLALAGAPLLPAASPALAAPPTATVTFADTQLTIGETTTVTMTFSEAVTGFTLADVVASAGTVTNLTTSDSIVYTATFTPTDTLDATTASVTVAHSGVADGSGTPGTGTSSATVAVDTLRPSASVVVADTTLQAGETSLVTITFSERVTSLDRGDLVVANGTVSWPSSADGGLTWTSELTPAADVDDPANVVTLTNSGVIDLAGNGGTGTTTSNSYAVRTVRPDATVMLADTALKAGETSTVTITFTGAVSGFTNADLTVLDGTLTPVGSTDGGVTWTTTFTPAAGVEAAGRVLTLDLTGVVNAAGNAGLGTVSSGAYVVDTRPPTATVAVADPVLGIGETTTATITFSEPVAGFSAADVVVTGGTVSALSTTDGQVWTATFTPAANTETTTASVRVDLSGVVDGLGNVGSGVTPAAPFTVDTVAPTATLALAASRVTGPTTLTVTFSEPVTTLTLADLTATRGTLSALATADGGTTWTATFTPDAGVSAAVTIALDLPGITDAAGNAGVAAVLSAPFAVDTAAPAPPFPPPPFRPTAPLPAAPLPAAPVAVVPAPSATAPVPAARPLAATGAEVLALLGSAVALVGTGLAALRLRGRRTRPGTR